MVVVDYSWSSVVFTKVLKLEMRLLETCCGLCYAIRVFTAQR